MPDSKSPSSPLDGATEAWLREMEEKFGPGAARISRRMEEWRVYELTALRYYQAVQEGKPSPQIADVVQQSYAWVMGQAVADLNEAAAHKDCFWERAHRSAVSRFHSAVYRYQSDRDELGLPLESSPEEISTAAHHRQRNTLAQAGPS
jgi:hypothetical protein